MGHKYSIAHKTKNHGVIFFVYFLAISVLQTSGETETELLYKSIDDIITPSDTCKLIVGRFASAISNFTLCSVTNARPIHLCQWCLRHYMRVGETHHDFTITIDEKGNPCRDYFTNLDRIEIVNDAYKYVEGLWNKGNCDYCFLKYQNGSLMPRATEETVKFEVLYVDVKACFNKFLESNDTCNECKTNYGQLNEFYIQICEKYGENVCLDIVDTMNTTRELWSELFGCFPQRKSETWLHIALISFVCLPLLFYPLAYLLSNKQESRVLTQRRLAEVFAASSSNIGSSRPYNRFNSPSEQFEDQ